MNADRQIVIPSRIRELRDTSLVTINVVQRLDEFELYSRPLLSVIFELNMFGSHVACRNGGKELKHFAMAQIRRCHRVYGA
jgi:hypothetical protein